MVNMSIWSKETKRVVYVVQNMSVNSKSRVLNRYFWSSPIMTMNAKKEYETIRAMDLLNYLILT